MKKSENKKNYTLKPVVKNPGDSKANSETPKKFRDITEDDDGYHPYADVPDNRPLFEKDPWR